jgi:hypothetical protein
MRPLCHPDSYFAQKMELNQIDVEGVVRTVSPRNRRELLRRCKLDVIQIYRKCTQLCANSN